MKLWNKTLLASALCLTLFGCDDASKVDNKLDKAKDNAEQMKDAAADKAQAIKQDADKQIDTLKSQADAEADRLKDQASAIKAEADKRRTPSPSRRKPGRCGEAERKAGK
ncbi:hypothetical protein KPZU09_12760 [Klebsiella pneumoniae]|uniref:Cell envelope integrity inner membrane protein TolA n=1 Tax=Klebsiella pneumoniae TaxID=573 RepID=A0A919HPU6_KLEPN|nr:hypothetical protein KPZU09_12760 [Klebsiella pneumoniae]